MQCKLGGASGCNDFKLQLSPSGHGLGGQSITLIECTIDRHCSTRSLSCYLFSMRFQKGERDRATERKLLNGRSFAVPIMLNQLVEKESYKFVANVASWLLRTRRGERSWLPSKLPAKPSTRSGSSATRKSHVSVRHAREGALVKESNVAEHDKRERRGAWIARNDMFGQVASYLTSGIDLSPSLKQYRAARPGRADSLSIITSFPFVPCSVRW